MKSLFWESLVFTLVGWGMYALDKFINESLTEVSTIGIMAGVLGLFGIIYSLVK